MRKNRGSCRIWSGWWKARMAEVYSGARTSRHLDCAARPGCATIPVPPRSPPMPTALDPGARRAILEAVDALREDSVEALARLVRCPSTLGREASALDEMARNYESLG